MGLRLANEETLFIVCYLFTNTSFSIQIIQPALVSHVRTDFPFLYKTLTKLSSTLDATWSIVYFTSVPHYVFQFCTLNITINCESLERIDEQRETIPRRIWRIRESPGPPRARRTRTVSYVDRIARTDDHVNRLYVGLLYSRLIEWTEFLVIFFFFFIYFCGAISIAYRLWPVL